MKKEKETDKPLQHNSLRGWRDAINAGTLKKIGDEPYCLNPEHNPPNMILLEPGTYEYECPGCHHRVIFTVPAIY